LAGWAAGERRHERKHDDEQRTARRDNDGKRDGEGHRTRLAHLCAAAGALERTVEATAAASRASAAVADAAAGRACVGAARDRASDVGVACALGAAFHCDVLKPPNVRANLDPTAAPKHE